MREDTNEVSANEMLLIFESNPVNEGLARVTAASFCTQLKSDSGGDRRSEDCCFGGSDKLYYTWIRRQKRKD